MFKLISFLCASVFLVLLIGGEDRGQLRFGLMDHYAPPPAPPPVEVAQASATPSVVLASYAPAAPEPVALPVPAPAEPVSAVQPDPQAIPVPEAAPVPVDIRYVSSNAINVRQGPSTNDAVIGRLTRNEAVTVVADNGDGWVQVRIEGDGIEGYVAGRLLTDRAP